MAAASLHTLDQCTSDLSLDGGETSSLIYDDDQGLRGAFCDGDSLDELFDSDQELHSCDASTGSDPIGMNEWINAAISSNRGVNYLESVVNLALALVKHLVQLQSASAVFKPEDITCDNLVIFVKPDVLLTSYSVDSDQHEQQTEIDRVKFLFEDGPSLQHANNSGSVRERVDPDQACSPLGSILLKLFSKGRSTTSVASDESGNNGLNQNGGDEHDGTMPSVAKRMAAVSITTDSPHEKTKKLLFDMGAPTSICLLICDLLDAKSNGRPSAHAIRLWFC